MASSDFMNCSTFKITLRHSRRSSTFYWRLKADEMRPALELPFCFNIFMLNIERNIKISKNVKATSEGNSPHYERSIMLENFILLMLI